MSRWKIHDLVVYSSRQMDANRWTKMIVIWRRSGQKESLSCGYFWKAPNCFSRPISTRTHASSITISCRNSNKACLNYCQIFPTAGHVKEFLYNIRSEQFLAPLHDAGRIPSVRRQCFPSFKKHWREHCCSVFYPDSIRIHTQRHISGNIRLRYLLPAFAAALVHLKSTSVILHQLKTTILTTNTMAEKTQTWQNFTIHHECHHKISYAYGSVDLAPSNAEIIFEPSEIWNNGPAGVIDYFRNKLKEKIYHKGIGWSQTTWAPFEKEVCFLSSWATDIGFLGNY